jgi:hypothetical protein
MRTVHGRVGVCVVAWAWGCRCVGVGMGRVRDRSAASALGTRVGTSDVGPRGPRAKPTKEPWVEVARD